MPHILRKVQKIALLSSSIMVSVGPAIGDTIQVDGSYPYSAQSNTGSRGTDVTDGGAGYEFLTNPETTASDNNVNVSSGVTITGGAGGNNGGNGGAGISGGNLTIAKDGGSIIGGKGNAGGSGGAGIFGNNLTIINNHVAYGDSISGGDGGRSSNISDSGAGGAGIAGNNLTIINSSNITGGNGGYLYDSGDGAVGLGGGAGGAGILGNELTIDNIAGGSITGGEGTKGANSGAGISGSKIMITNNGSITGGRGSYGYGDNGGTSGIGAAGIVGNDMTIINNNRIAGGEGDSGSRGGAGISGNNLKITNSRAIIGGNGGFGYGESAGTGGAGISGNDMMIDNIVGGSITGGEGGYGGLDGAGGAGVTGIAGAGIFGNYLTINNSGTISGGKGSFAGGETWGTDGGNGGVGISGSNLTIDNKTGGSITGGVGYYGGGRDSTNAVNGGYGGEGISGSNLKITNSGSISGGDGSYGKDGGTGGSGGSGISGKNLTITHHNGSISGGRGGGYRYSDNSNGGNGGAGISGSNLTITNSSSITGGNGGPSGSLGHKGKDGAAIDLTGGNNFLTLNTGSNIIGDITLADSTSDNSTTLLISGNDMENRVINGNLMVGQSASVTLAEQPIVFAGNASFAEGASLTLGGGVSLKAASLFVEDGAALNANIIRWDQRDILLVETTDGITGTFSFNNALVAGMSQPDFAYINAGNRIIQYSLYWNGLDSDAHGTFTLDEDRDFNLGVALADNIVHTNLLWDGKSLTKAGKGTLILSAENTYTGLTYIHDGTLKTVIPDAFANTSGVEISEGATFNLNGNDQTVNMLDNRGTLLIDDYGVQPLSPLSVTLAGNVANSGNIILNNSATSAGNTLTINGDYVGNDGTLSLGTVLGGDSSLTDKLVITGNATGTTYVAVSNENGSGDLLHEGINIIETGSSMPNAFVQRGRIVAGSYEYYVKQGTVSGENLNNWYLTSMSNSPNPDDSAHSVNVYRPEGGSYASNLAAANTLFNTRLNDRQGSIWNFDPVAGNGGETSMWLRLSGGHNQARMSDGQNKFSANRVVMQLGGDLAQGSVNSTNRYHLGIMGGYGKQYSNTHNRQSGYSSRGEVSGYSAGLYGTWYQNAVDKTGLYVDSWMLYNWFDNTVKGNELAYESYKSKGITASVESGYTFHAGSYTTMGNMENNVYIRPQAQVIWMGVKANDHTEKNGTQVQGQGNDNVQTRLGVRLYINGKSQLDKNSVREFQPFVETNWVYNSKQYGVRMKDTSTHIQGSRNIGEVKIGVEGRLSQNLSVWGNVAQQAGEKGFRDTGGVLGVKYQF